jgi:1-aminocyclopropane-1-carboxylate deaminase
MFAQLAHAIPEHHIVYQGVDLTIRRLDLVHPQISGNKFFKLKYNLQQALAQGKTQILTFGGAYSNHIAATAFAAHHFGLTSIGIIRGQELAQQPLNPTLSTAAALGMQLHFVSRETYRRKAEAEYLASLSAQFPHAYIVPEGGTNALAIQGCREILMPHHQHMDVICCAVGTGGTLTGLIESSHPQQHILGFSALKGQFLTQEVAQLTQHQHWSITDEFCCGGYAKTTPELLQFMHSFEQRYAIPLEPIYTAKMFFGVFRMIERGELTPQTKILLLHSGGLQGRSEQSSNFV